MARRSSRRIYIPLQNIEHRRHEYLQTQIQIGTSLAGLIDRELVQVAGPHDGVSGELGGWDEQN